MYNSQALSTRVSRAKPSRSGIGLCRDEHEGSQCPSGCTKIWFQLLSAIHHVVILGSGGDGMVVPAAAEALRVP